MDDISLPATPGLPANEARSATLCVVGPAEHFHREEYEHCRAGSRQEDCQRRGVLAATANGKLPIRCTILVLKSNDTLHIEQISKEWRCVGI